MDRYIFALFLFYRGFVYQGRGIFEEGKEGSLTHTRVQSFSFNTIQIANRLFSTVQYNLENRHALYWGIYSLRCASTLGIPFSAFYRFYWSLSIRRQRGGWLGVAHPKTLAHPVRINCPVLDAGHNDDHPAFRECESRGRRRGGGGGSTWSILEYQNFLPQQLSGDLE